MGLQIRMVEEIGQFAVGTIVRTCKGYVAEKGPRGWQVMGYQGAQTLNRHDLPADILWLPDRDLIAEAKVTGGRIALLEAADEYEKNGYDIPTVYGWLRARAYARRGAGAR